MLEGTTFWQLMWQGGWAVYILVIMSVISLAMIAERAYRFYQARINLAEFMGEFLPYLEKNNRLAARNVAEATRGPVSRVVLFMLDLK